MESPCDPSKVGLGNMQNTDKRRSVSTSLTAVMQYVCNHKALASARIKIVYWDKAGQTL